MLGTVDQTDCRIFLPPGEVIVPDCDAAAVLGGNTGIRPHRRLGIPGRGTEKHSENGGRSEARRGGVIEVYEEF